LNIFVRKIIIIGRRDIARFRVRLAVCRSPGGGARGLLDGGGLLGSRGGGGAGGLLDGGGLLVGGGRPRHGGGDSRGSFIVDSCSIRDIRDIGGGIRAVHHDVGVGLACVSSDSGRGEQVSNKSRLSNIGW
jgi:hypothetical protein